MLAREADYRRVPTKARTIRIGAVLRVLPLLPLLMLPALAGKRPAGSAVHVVPSSDTGVVSLSNSRGGGAIVNASDIMPGQTVSGSVGIANSGDSAAALRLSQSQPQDAVGVGGGHLSDALSLAIDDLSAGRRVYQGAMSAFQGLALGTLPAGQSHQYRFTVTMADVPGSTYQGASTMVRYDWTGAAVTDTSGGGTGTGTGGGTGTGTGTGTITDTRPPVLKLTGKPKQRAKKAILNAACDEVCTLGASAKLKGAKGAKAPKVQIARVNVAAGGRSALRLKFDKRSLRKIRKGTVTVTVRATDAAGNRSVATRKITVTR